MDLPVRSLQVLLVEHDTNAARGLARLLREDKHDVEVALDGAAAIARLANGAMPDVLITDFRVPHADARALVAFARARWPRLPVIVVTGYAEEARSWCAALSPEVAMLTKPLNYDALTEKLDALRARPSMLP